MKPRAGDELLAHASESQWLTRSGRRKLVVRPVDAGDRRLLFDWVNRPDNLAYMLRTEGAVAWADHQRWFDARLRDDGSAIWIGELDQRPAGQVRLQRSARGLVVSIYVDPGSRRRGVASGLLRHADAQAAIRWPGAPIVADVQQGNDASRALFLAAGYVHAQRHASHDEFRLVRPAGSGQR